MWRLPRLTLIFWLLVGTLFGIIALFVIGVTFDLTQIFAILVLVFFDSNCVTAGSGSVGSLALLAFAIQTRILFGLTQSLLKMASISTITLVSRWRAMNLFNLRILVLVIVTPSWFVITGTVCIVFVRRGRSLAKYFSLGIDSLFNDPLSIIQVVVSFV